MKQNNGVYSNLSLLFTATIYKILSYAVFSWQVSGKLIFVKKSLAADSARAITKHSDKREDCCFAL
jgi:hypothetical protein